MTQNFYPAVAVRVIFLACVSLGAWSPARAECTPPGTPSADSIVCTGTDTNGVASDGGNDTITISSGASILLTPPLTQPKATAVDAGADQDSVFNAGAIVAEVMALVVPVPVPPALVPGFSGDWDGAAKADSEAKGIDGGTGIDVITNTGSVSPSSSATVVSAGVPGLVEGVSNADLSSTANASSTAIDGGDGNDSISNSGGADTDATATAAGVTVTFAPGTDTGSNGKSKVDGDVKASADATGIAGGAGDDTVTNSGSFVVTSSATTLAADGGGVAAQGSAAVSASSTSEADAAAINLGGGNDTLANHAAITATADSNSTALNVSIGDTGGSTSDNSDIKSATDGGATANASAIGIAADSLETDSGKNLSLATDATSMTLSYQRTKTHASGDDNVTNDAAVTANATSITHAPSVGVAIAGAATANATSKADSGAAAIDLGGGNDTLTNTGELTATANSTANATGVAIGVVSAPSEVNAGTGAESRATGIAADGLEGDTTQALTLVINDNNTGSLTYSKSDIRASGDDHVTNDGVVTANATSTTHATSVGVSIVGGATAKVTSEAESGATAVDLGGGNDTLVNTGVLTSTATSDATAVGVNVGVAIPTEPDKLASFIPALSGLDASTSAESRATGIAADSLEGDSTQNFDLSILDNNGSLAGSLTYSKSNIRASGDDNVTNDGAVNASATSTSQATSVGVTVIGAASAKAKSEAESDAVAIDLGGGDDTLVNTGALTATATSDATAVGVGVGVMFPIPPPSSGSSGAPSAPSTPSVNDIFKTKSDVDASTRATSRATGIAADSLEGDARQDFSVSIQNNGGSLTYSKSNTRASGDDVVTNNGAVNASATSTTHATSVGVTIGGDATTKATSEAESDAVAVDLGGGDDTLVNTGALTATATSDATAVGVSVGATFGVTNTSKSDVDASTSAQSRATGIAADSLEGDTRQNFSLSIQDSNGSFGGSLTYSKSNIRASGDDNVTNNGAVNANATSTTHATSVGVTVGEATAKAKSEAESNAVAIDLGGGDDTLTNTGLLSATADSTASAVGVNVGIIASSPSTPPPTGGTPPTPPAPDASDKPSAKSTVDASTSAQSRAAGIAADSLEGDTRQDFNLSIQDNGGSLTYSNSEIRASGDDNVVNHGAVDASATSTTTTVSVGVTIGGDATAKATSEAESDAVAIDLGGGNDRLANTGALTSTATSHATAVGVTLGAEIPAASDELPNLLPPKSDVDASASAQSRASGIAADSLEGDTRKDFGLSIQDSNGSFNGSLTYSKSEIRASGDDSVTNNGAVNASATSTTPAVSVGVMIGGATTAKATSAAESDAVAIDLGGGNDRLANTGALTSTATSDATAVGVGVGVTIPSASDAPVSIIPATSVVDAGASARSRATGIAADSLEGDTRQDFALSVQDSNGSFNGSLTYSKSEIRASGDDSVTNNSAVNASATSTTHATSVGVMIGVQAAAKATSEAESDAAAIDLGGGNDMLTNTGQLTATSDSTANAVGVAVGVAIPSTPDSPATLTPSESIVDASASAQSRASGIAADSLEGDTRQDFGLSIQDSNGSLGGSLTYSKSNIRASGDDYVTNHGVVNASATATAPAVSVGVTLGGAATAKATSASEAGAVAVDLGGGNDTLMNTGALTSTATSDATAVGVAVGVVTSSTPISLLTAKSDVDASTSARSRATGIAADSLEGDTRQEFSLSLQDGGGTPGGSLIYSKSEIRASGDDNVTNNGAVNANATSTTRSASVGVSIDGGTATAKVTSEAESGAVAVDLGGGNDMLTNTGQLTATSDSTANALGVAVGVDAKKSDVDASASAQSRATGIAADSLEGDARQDFSLSVQDNNGSLDGSLTYSKSNIRASGDDHVTNSAAVTANATSTTRVAGVGVSIDGEATAKATSEAESGAVAVDLGGGNDMLTNTGPLTATSDSTANALGVAVGVDAKKSDVDADSNAKSRATGIAADSLEGDTTQEFSLSLQGSGDSLDGSLTYSNSETHASGDDSVINHGEILAQSQATTRSAGVGVTIGGEASSKAASTSEAEAVAVDLGGGNDMLTNTGTLTSTATSHATALDVAVGVKTDPADEDKLKSAADASTTATSRATGIAADGVDGDTVKQARITYDSTGAGLSASQTETFATGDDNVSNSAAVNATARSISNAGAVGVAIKGAASAKSTSTADSAATAIDLGGGDDTLTNNTGGTLTASALSRVSALNVAVGVSSGSSSGDSKSKSAADGSAEAEATAIGIAADGVHGDSQKGLDITFNDNGLTLDYYQSETHASGDDIVLNDAAINAGATAITRSATVGVTVKGTASAKSTSDTEARTAAIELGGGSDTLTNTGNLTSIADSTSSALKAAVSSDGRATSSDGFWHGGTKAESSAIGIDASGSANDTSTKATLRVGDSGVHFLYEKTVDNAATDGIDSITNYGDILARSSATSNAVNVSVTSDGTAAAISHVEAKAGAVGIQGGNGGDTIYNLGTGQLTASADAHANAGQVAVSGKGAAVTADALWDGGTQAESTAVGIDADGGATDRTSLSVDIDASGVSVVNEHTTTNASGNDTIFNEQDINATAETTAPSVGVSLEAKKGLAASISSVDAQAASTAIRGGSGDDDIVNLGKLASSADAKAGAANVAIAKDGVAAASDSVWDGGTTATASAVGIDADGGDLSKTVRTTLTVDGSGATIEHETTTQAASGNDTVLNVGVIDATATALSGSASIGIVAKGLSAALSQSTAKADATAIHGGDGDDSITNHGKLTANATATATALSVAVTSKGVALAGNASWDGGVTAEATAKGIDADGGDRTSNSVTTIKTGGDAGIDRSKTSEAASGNDVITNTGEIDATAHAIAPEVSAAIAITGVPGAVSTATATSHATAIDAGAGDDQVTNTGKLNATASSVAVAVNGSATSKGVAISADGVWDGGTKANATAKGIDAGDGNDVIDNGADIEAHATAVAPSVSGSVAVQGVAGAISASTATSNATAIDGGDGDDTIHNTGKLTSTSVANADGVSVAVTTEGVALAGDNAWDGGVTADATARGIDAGPGNDTVFNEGEIDTHATAVSPDVAISVAMQGVGGAVSTSTATARATGIDASAASTSGHGGTDTITNTARITSNADATAVAVNGTFTSGGVAISADGVWDGGTHADATALGIQTSGQDDTINNGGEIDTSATAVAPSITGSVAVEGVAGAISAATATSNATAIDAGAGNDTITNTGKLTSTSVANADAVSVAVTTAGGALAGDNSWDGGVTADATAKGIDAGTGFDTVYNEGEIDSHATAVSPDVAVSVAVSGGAGAVSTATATAQSSGIDASADYPDGADVITNKAKISSHADATAVAVNGSVTTAGVAISADGIWDGGTHANATATGIHAGMGDDTLANDGEIDVGATSVAPSISGSVAVSGVAGAISTATSTANATAIDANDGNDSVNNTAKLTASTVANADGVSVTVTTAGVAVAGDTAWDGGTTAEATAKGIDGGKGQDGITNSGDIDAGATAVSTGTDVSVAVAGLGGAISAAKSQAQATAIDGGDGNDTITNTGKLSATTVANTDTVAAAISVYGVGVAGNNSWDDGTTADARSMGIYGGIGQDVIDNGGEIVAQANAVSPSVGVGFDVFGVSGALTTATARSHATAIDAGDDSDQVHNTSRLTSNADATGVAVNAAFSFGGVSGTGDSVWDGGTTAEATAKGIDGGKGQDRITNEALIETTANSTAVSNSDTVSVFGVAGATSSANSTANATAIDGGDDNDVLTNSGELKATSDASATGVSVAVTAIGASVGTDSFWNGGTTADSTAKGMDGGTGDDLITNSGGPITADATAETHSVSVSATGAILAAASASSTSTATAAAIDGGAGNDDISNDSALVSRATSSAGGVSVSVALAGGALSGSPFDNATQASATANGIEGGAGDDMVYNTESSSITLDSHAIAKDTAVSVGVIGFSGTKSGSMATARGTGIDGGDGNDILDNQGAITGTVTAEGKSHGISVTLTGVTIDDASTMADAGITGIAGGAGDDSITNAGAITLTPHAEATGSSVGVSVSGLSVSIGDASANAASSATGIDGGQGNNDIVNRGIITETVTANGTAHNVGVGLGIGSTVSKADTTATTDAAGIRGGDDNDNVWNENIIDVTAASTAAAHSVSVIATGASKASARILPGATAVGIDGGAGDDMISNSAAITANATADGVASSSSWTIAGVSKSDSGTVATTVATGIAGGDGDDFIENLAAIGAHAGSTVSVDGGGFTFAGTGKSTAQLTATTDATGISGGDGSDYIRSEGAVTVDAASALTSTGGKIVPAGQSDVGANIGATTTVTGIDGGAGDDSITNLDTVDVTAGSTVTQDSSTFTFGGVGATDGTLLATGIATGIAGGDGSDAIDSEGAVIVHATSSLSSTGGSVTPFGTSAATTTIGANTTATGIDGGAGDDSITNLATIDVTASSTVTQHNSSFTFGGTGATGGSLEATTHATGISGGDGADGIHSEKAITVNASSALSSTGGSTTPFGTSQAGATIGADTTATGVDGGAGDDAVMNLDAIDVTANSTVTLGGTSFSLGGTGNAAGSLEASSRATGIAGGSGQDQLQNLGAMTVHSSSNLDSRSNTNVGFGTSNSGGSAGATTVAVGIDGGSDDDFLNNLGAIDVTADSTVTMNGSTYTFGGTGSSAGTLAASTRATGMSGGDGADRLRNQGDVVVNATSTLDSKGESKATFGTSSGGATSGAVTEATGLDGGAGDNDIENLLGKIDVSALTTVTADKAAYTFGGTASSSAVLDGTARASGIYAGDGANTIRNDAALSAVATANVTATGGTKTTFGSTNSNGTATADALAQGIGTGAGADAVLNTGTMTVNAAADATTSNSANAGSIAGSANTVSNATGTATAYGVSAGDGDNAYQNDGDLNVTAKGTGYAFAVADGAHLSWSGNGQARADSNTSASATGILAGNGNNQIINNKAITVLAQATTEKALTTTTRVCTEHSQPQQECEQVTDPDTGEVTTVCHDVVDSNGDPVYEVVSDCQDEEVVLGTNPTYAAANGNGVSGDGNALSTGSGSAEAYGIKAGDGDNHIVNNQDISVMASPVAKATVSSSGGTTGDATGTASASASATAYGIWAGNGNNDIANNGTLTVTAAPKAQANANIAAGKGVCIHFLFWTWCIADGTGTGSATATFDSLAVGIRTGDGNNLITNNGTLTVAARPETDGAPVSVTTGIDHRTLHTYVTSQAVGIQTGNGDNQIYNTANGVIDVGATDVPGYGCSPSPCSVSAIGIQTGDGNNVVVNDGTITTTVTSGGSSHAGVAINTGGGNDIVQLGDGSTTLGSIALNAGDDSLSFIGSARLAGLNDAPGSVDGGAGTDSLYFSGAGSFTGNIQNFENAAKDGTGTFVLSSLPTMQQIRISQGTLQTNSSYSFASGGSYEAWIYGGGDHGMLLANNGTATLAGNLSVNKGHGAYIDGTTYDVVEATEGVSGSFSDVLLPAPSPLLNFSYLQTPDAAQVEANVASFTTMATNPVSRAVATYLDSILPTATGDLSDVLGNIQSLSAPELTRAYASLSPDTFSSYTQAAAGGIAANSNNLQLRMQTIRLASAADSTRSASFSDGKPVMLAYNGETERLGSMLEKDAEGSRQGRYGLWLNALGQLGNQDTDNTHAGYDYNVGGMTLGFDHGFTENVLAGISLGYARTNVNLDQNLGNGDINSSVYSIYGSYFNGKGYVDGTLSYGANRYANTRNIQISGSNALASSYHDGRLLSGTVSGGYYFDVSGWTWEPYAAMQYISLAEDSFDESGAGAVGLHVDARRTQYLDSDLGLRFLRTLPKANGTLVPQLSLAWNYNFNIDDGLITAAFTGAPNTAFSVEGQNIARNGARLGGGVAYISKQNLSSSLYYTAELRDGYVANSLIGEIRYEFK